MTLQREHHLPLRLALAFQSQMARRADGNEVFEAVRNPVVGEQPKRNDMVNVKLLAVIDLGDMAAGAAVSVAGTSPIALSMPIRTALVTDATSPHMALVSGNRCGDTLNGTEAPTARSWTSEVSLSAKLSPAGVARQVEEALATYRGAATRAVLTRGVCRLEGRAAMSARASRERHRSAVAFLTAILRRASSNKEWHSAGSAGARWWRIGYVSALHAAKARAQLRGPVEHGAADLASNPFEQRHTSMIYIFSGSRNGKSSTTRGAGTTLLGAIRTGRRAVGGDALREHAEIAAGRVSGMQQVPLFGATP